MIKNNNILKFCTNCNTCVFILKTTNKISIMKEKRKEKHALPPWSPNGKGETAS